MDFGAALVLAVLAFPFPVVRASVAVPVFVGLILISIALVHAAYLSVTAWALGRTPGMYFTDLGFLGGSPSGIGSLGWALRTTVAFLPVVLGLLGSEDPGVYAGGSVALASTSESGDRVKRDDSPR